MADDVQITVGVTLDQLAAGVNAAKDSLSTLKTSVQALAGGFALREISEFVGSMAELGLQAERTAAILGITTVSAQELAGISLLSGGSADQLTSSLSRLQLGLERGQRATSAQAAAFRALGIDMQQMLASSPDRQVDILANAVQRLHDQGINAAPALSLINRGLANLMPMLQGGAAEVDHFRQRLIDVGAIVSADTTEKLTLLHQELTLMSEAFKGLGETIVAQGAFKEFAAEVSQAVGNLTALIATGNLTEYVLSYLSSTADKLGAALVKLGFEALDVATFGIVGFRQEIEKADAAMRDADKDLSDLNARFEEMAKNLRSEIGAQAGKGLKPITVDVSGVSDQLKKVDEFYKAEEERIKQSYNLYAITEREKTSELIANVNARAAAEIAAGQKADIANAKAAADIAKINADAAKKVTDEWKSVADKFASDFSNAIDQVLTKQESFGQAMVQMMGKMIEQMIAYIIKLIAEYAILNAAALTYDILTGGSGVAFGSAVNAGAPAGASGPTIAGLIGHDAGTPFIENTGIAMLHEGEAVIPAEGNPFSSGSGTTNNNSFGGGSININAMDAASFVSMLRRNPNAFASLFDRLSQRNSLATLLR